ncbi:MAG TPA: sugar ABC transporter ATP-binding protein [Candidatus Anaerotruncus excrementipullorum]|uniref:Ribose/galactose/methyl galactoside import ATP-binding protein n=1 Tax=Candidatus Anaerotruncus excrementipullorum TaxID=2838465 RepID=A0A9D1WSF7_9FIRM|nr:sugar ABC transporter ATP-binding protein [Candidatus Anaerotruncus excrementipullorum]
MSSENGYILEMNNITKRFPGVLALDKVTLKVKPGTVHALMGENGAGKSTLMKCLFGIYVRDEGDVILDGQSVNFSGTLDAIQHGIAMIHQELHPEPHLTVMENVWLGRLPKKGIVVDYGRMYRDTKELLERLKLSMDPKALVKTLSVSQIQAIEIAKAVSFNAKVIIMDEPTSSLTEDEVEHLFEIIRDLRSKGVAVIYISHKMEEIKQISDQVSIMRDGQMIGTWESDELTTDMIISKMVGRDLSNRFPPKTNTPGEVYLRVENFSSIYPRSFQDVSFELRRGEILGLGGLVGAQRTELMEAVFGLRRLKSGKLYINGQEKKITSSSDAMDNGMAMLTEDRKGSGIFPILGVGENTYIAVYKRLAKFLGFINLKKCVQLAQESIKRLAIKTPSIKTPISSLSGGNQQKVLFARWLLTEPEILLLDEPTRGIDVGAKYEIYSIIADLAAQGKCIIMISSEMPELIGMADRIMVMCEGKKAGELEGDAINEEEIMRLATKFMV